METLFPYNWIFCPRHPIIEIVDVLMNFRSRAKRIRNFLSFFQCSLAKKLPAKKDHLLNFNSVNVQAQTEQNRPHRHGKQLSLYIYRRYPNLPWCIVKWENIRVFFSNSIFTTQHDQRTPMISNIVGARLNLYMFIICFLVIKFHKLFPLKCVQFVVFEGPFLYMISVLYIIPVPKLYK